MNNMIHSNLQKLAALSGTVITNSVPAIMSQVISPNSVAQKLSDSTPNISDKVLPTSPSVTREVSVSTPNISNAILPPPVKVSYDLLVFTSEHSVSTSEVSNIVKIMSSSVTQELPEGNMA